MRERGSCRLCGGRLTKVFELKPSPIANAFADEPNSDAVRYPQELMQCRGCGHVQQRYVHDGLFEDYKYQTPATVAEYLKPIAKRIADKHPGARVLEIGCNNGVFLDCLLAEGLDAWGVDPAANHPRAHKAYFGAAFAEKCGKFDVVVANNVFAHIDDLTSVFEGITTVLEPDGCLIFESQYLVDLIESGAFDMIYHEHLDYHTLGPLKPFLWRFGLVMTGWEHIPTHGGSIRVTAHKMGEECETPEEALDWDGLRAKIEAARERVHAAIGSGKVQAFGASAKATTLIAELDLQDRIEFVVDDTPQKQFRYIPGTDIPVYPVAQLKDGPVLLTAWNYEKEIAQRIPNRLINPFARDHR